MSPMSTEPRPQGQVHSGKQMDNEGSAINWGTVLYLYTHLRICDNII